MSKSRNNNNVLHFTVGTPWRRKTKGDPELPEMDFSVCDSWVCPIYVNFGNNADAHDIRFVMDVRVDHNDIDPNHPHARLAVHMRASMVVAAFNHALSTNPGWLTNLRLLIAPSVDDTVWRYIEEIDKHLAKDGLT